LDPARQLFVKLADIVEVPHISAVVLKTGLQGGGCIGAFDRLLHLPANPLVEGGQVLRNPLESPLVRLDFSAGKVNRLLRIRDPHIPHQPVELPADIRETVENVVLGTEDLRMEVRISHHNRP
jgi:hypothetical protein